MYIVPGSTLNKSIIINNGYIISSSIIPSHRNSKQKYENIHFVLLSGSFQMKTENKCKVKVKNNDEVLNTINYEYNLLNKLIRFFHNNNINCIISKYSIPEWSEQIFKNNNIIVIDGVNKEDLNNLSNIYNVSPLLGYSECIFLLIINNRF